MNGTLMGMCADIVAKKDKKIAELEDKIRKQEIDLSDADCLIHELDRDLKITEKALELVCERVVERYTPSERAEGYGCNPKYFINKAKEMMKGE